MSRSEASEAVRLDQATIEWMHQHEPARLRTIELASLRRARLFLVLGLLLLAAGTVGTGMMLWAVASYRDLLSPFRYATAATAGGFLVGASLQFFWQAQGLRLISLLKGEGMRRAQKSGQLPRPTGA